MPYEEEIKKEYFECSCFSEEHTLRFTLYPAEEDSPPDLFTSVFLNQHRGFFRRLWIAFRYLFGYKCRYGHWDCFLLNPKDVDRMILLLQAYKNELNNVSNSENL